MVCAQPPESVVPDEQSHNETVTQSAGQAPGTRAAASIGTATTANSTQNRVPFVRTEKNNTPRSELFGGFSYQRRQNGMRLAGLNAAANLNLTPWFGLTADAAIQSPDFAFLDATTDPAKRYSLLFGPQLSVRGSKLTGFARSLFGTHYYAGFPRVNNGWNFAYGFGGGVDVRLSRLFAVRPVQWDYIVIDGRDSHLSAHRVSIGGVVRF